MLRHQYGRAREVIIENFVSFSILHELAIEIFEPLARV